MADDGQPPSSSDEPSPVDPAAETFAGTGDSTVPPAPAPEPREARTSVWQRHWVAFGGLVFFALCVRALVEAPLPAWHPDSTPGSAPPAGPLAVIIDPGHGGGDSGAVSQGVVEKDLNLDVGRRVAGTLAARGVKVRLTREDDHFVSLEDRVRMGNAQPGTVFVSIHFNDASGDGRVAMNRASGIETFYSQNKAMAASASFWR